MFIRHGSKGTGIVTNSIGPWAWRFKERPLKDGYNLTGVNRCVLVHALMRSDRYREADFGNSLKKPGPNPGGRAAAGAVGPDP